MCHTSHILCVIALSHRLKALPPCLLRSRSSVLFIIGKLVNSQAAGLLVVAPMALQLGVDPVVIVGFIGASYGYFILPTYPSDLAAIGFDPTGTTHIGKYVINHSFLVPGLIGVAVSCLVGTGLSRLILA